MKTTNNYVAAEILKKFYKKRPLWSKKGDFGKVLIIGGSNRFTGCLALAGIAALRAGADLVTVYAPERAANIVASVSADLITIPAVCKYFNRKFVDDALLLALEHDSVLIGNGLLRNKETKQFVIEFLSRYNGRAVIDADALHAIASQLSVISGREYILTPHAHEFYVLSGEKVSSDINERAKKAKMFAEKFNVTVLLKGHIDVIADKSRVALNATGSPYMSVAGTGDCLAGIAAALLAISKRATPFDCACASAFINGSAGNIAASILGPSLMASDILNFIPSVIAEVNACE